jgi:hypothetical protein
MICNVCGDESRCYTLIEADMRHMQMRPIGMMFKICTKCLGKLVDAIKTEKTVLDDPEDPVNFPSLRNKVRPPLNSRIVRSGK